ncbi:MAG: CocE/NonD family hydrolase [Bacteroidaceae bacterium]|nr:CocE/NonD family hydrolase [Bacteroidaceae bacterium]
MKRLRLVVLMVFATLFAVAQGTDSITKEWVRNHYDKREVRVMMRDGVHLHTIIYEPKDHTVRHPIIMQRSCYSSAPYGEAYMELERPAWREFTRNGYIFVFQDVRGKNMSEGTFTDVRPFVEGKKKPKFNKKGEIVKANPSAPIDEASDTYDTAEWLVHNTNSNGNIGVFGISYPGFYSTMAGMSGHPAVKAVSPQAPVTDWFRGDDAHHNGALFLLDMFSFQYWFEYRNTPAFHNARYGGTMPKVGPSPADIVRNDVYTDYLKRGAVKNFTALFGDSVQGWNDVVHHPDLDQWWEDRNVLNHCQNSTAAVMVVGGLFDAEDCYGAFATYKQLRKDAKNRDVFLVEGPWSHGGWGRGARPFFGHVYFGPEQVSDYYLKKIEYPFFAYYLEGKGEKPAAVRVYDSGSCRWNVYSGSWPIKSDKTPYWLTEDGLLAHQVKKVMRPLTYVSDPARPVPYVMEPGTSRTTEYMLDDQRFAATRPDVLVFDSPVLTDTLQLAGEVEAELEVSISTTDADFIVKLIDVFPEDFAYPDSLYADGFRNDYYPMGGYQMLVRGEVIRGKYRNSLSNPEPFVPNEKTTVKFRLPDVAHTFLPGHRLMVQVQSTWFPLVDRNPQRFCNIYECNDSDFQTAIITIHPDSKIWLPVVKH